VTDRRPIRIEFWSHQRSDVCLVRWSFQSRDNLSSLDDGGLQRRLVEGEICVVWALGGERARVSRGNREWMACEAECIGKFTREFGQS